MRNHTLAAIAALALLLALGGAAWANGDEPVYVPATDEEVVPCDEYNAQDPLCVDGTPTLPTPVTDDGDEWLEEGEILELPDTGSGSTYSP